MAASKRLCREKTVVILGKMRRVFGAQCNWTQGLKLTGSTPVRRTCSRFGRPAAEDGRQIAVSVYCGKIAAVIPAIEYVAGQQVFKQLF